MDTLNEVQSVKAICSAAGGIPPLNHAAGAIAVTGIDRTGFQSCQVAAFVGVTSGSPDSFTFPSKLQHNTVATAGDSGWADADACGLDSPATADLTTITAENTESRKAFNLNPAKQFIRAHATPAFVNGSSPKVNACVVIILGGAVDKPVTL